MLRGWWNAGARGDGSVGTVKPIRSFAVASLLSLVGACSKPDEAQPPSPAAHAAEPSETAKTEPPGPVPPRIEDAIAQANASHKPLVLEFYTSWCHPCQEFAKTTLVDKRVEAALGDVMFVRYNTEVAPGDAAGTRYKVSSFPTFITVDKQGEVVSRHSGMQTGEAGVKDFLAMIGDARLKTRDEADVRAELSAKPKDAGVELSAGRWYADHDRTSDAVQQLDAVAANPSATAAQRATSTATAKRLRRLALWKQQLVAEKLELASGAPGSVGEHDLMLATVDSGAAPSDIHAVFTKVFAVQTDPSVVNGLLYVALAAGAKDEALAAAKRTLGDSKSPDMLDTLAECFHVHGDRDDALRIEDQALTLSGSKNPALAENRARFAKGEGDSTDVIAVHAKVAATWKRIDHAEDEPTPDVSNGMPPGFPPPGAHIINLTPPI